MGNETRASDTPGTIKGQIVTNIANCHPPDPGSFIALSHRRCTGGTFGVVAVALEADRLPDGGFAVCIGQPTPNAIPFTTRETTAEGRGRIDDTHLAIPLAGPPSEACRVRISGNFHREGTVYKGKLGIDVHRADDTFRHSYCATFEGEFVPPNVVNIELEGVGHDDTLCAALPDGRAPTDSTDTLHHDTLVLP
jgi:hypothetical protein